MPQRDLIAEYHANPTPFGRLVPLHYVRRTPKEVFWLFQCQCGTIKEIAVGKIQPGCTQSCGCLKREQSAMRILPLAGHNRLPIEQAAVQLIYRRYQFQAESRRLVFELSLDQLAFLIVQPCYICHTPYSNEQRVGKRAETFMYNGIDRLDNGQGYVDGNVAACCKQCNFIKGEMSLHELWSWIDRVQETRI